MQICGESHTQRHKDGTLHICSSLHQTLKHQWNIWKPKHWLWCHCSFINQQRITRRDFPVITKDESLGCRVQPIFFHTTSSKSNEHQPYAQCILELGLRFWSHFRVQIESEDWIVQILGEKTNLCLWKWLRICTWTTRTIKESSCDIPLQIDSLWGLPHCSILLSLWREMSVCPFEKRFRRL